MCVFASLCDTTVRSLVEGDLSIDCQRQHVLECLGYLDRLRLEVSSGDTSEMFGQ